MKKTKRSASKSSSAEYRLATLLGTKDCIPFHENLPDKEYPYILLSIYGSIKTNELFVKVSNGKVVFVEAIPSPLFSPSMANRIFGMDVADSNVAFRHAEIMWEKHKHDLIGK